MNSFEVGDRVSFVHNGVRYPGTVSHSFSKLTIIEPDQPFNVRGGEVAQVSKEVTNG